MPCTTRILVGAALRQRAVCTIGVILACTLAASDLMKSFTVDGDHWTFFLSILYVAKAALGALIIASAFASTETLPPPSLPGSLCDGVKSKCFVWTSAMFRRFGQAVYMVDHTPMNQYSTVYLMIL